MAIRRHAIVNWTLRNKLEINQNAKLFSHENASENMVCEMPAILSQRVNIDLMDYMISNVTAI